MDFHILFLLFFNCLTYPDNCYYFLARRREECEEVLVKYSMEELSAIAVDCGYKLHVNLGPGLLESVYEALLANALERRGLRVDRQKPIRIKYENIVLKEGFRADLIVEERLLLELKSTERHRPVHAKQVLTYLRLMHLPLVGGAVMTFADVLGAFGGFANLPEGSNGTTTSESKTNFLNAAPEGQIVYGESVPLKVGRRQSVWQTRISLEDGTLVVVVTQTQIVL